MSAALRCPAAACVPPCTQMTLVTKAFAGRAHTASVADSAEGVLAEHCLHLQSPSRCSPQSYCLRGCLQLSALVYDTLLQTCCTVPDSRLCLKSSLTRPEGIAHLCPCGVGSLLLQGCIYLRAFLRLSRLLPIVLTLYVLCKSPGMSDKLRAVTAGAAHRRPPSTPQWVAAKKLGCTSLHPNNRTPGMTNNTSKAQDWQMSLQCAA